MSERNYLLPLFAIGIGVFFIAAFVTGVVVWHHMAVIVSAPPPSATTPIPTLMPVPTPTPIPIPTPTPIPTPIVAADPAETVTVPTTNVPNAAAAIARLRPGFRSCYNRGLAKDPNLAGAITITIAVAANGDVTSVTKKSGGLNAEVDECIMRRARGATFDATPSGATVDVPVRFERVN